MRKKKSEDFEIRIKIKPSTVEELRELIRARKTCLKIRDEATDLPQHYKNEVFDKLRELDKDACDKLDILYMQIMTEYIAGNSAAILSVKTD